MKKAVAVLFIVFSSVLLFGESKPKDVWLSFGNGYKKSLVLGYCYGLQDAYANYQKEFIVLNKSKSLGFSESEMVIFGKYLKYSSDSAANIINKIDDYIEYVNNICLGKINSDIDIQTASIQGILRYSLETYPDKRGL